MARIGIVLSEQAHHRLNVLTRLGQRTSQNDVVEALIQSVTDEEMLKLMESRHAEANLDKKAARVLRGKLARLSPERLQAILNSADIRD